MEKGSLIRCLVMWGCSLLDLDNRLLVLLYPGKQAEVSNMRNTLPENLFLF